MCGVSCYNNEKKEDDSRKLINPDIMSFSISIINVYIDTWWLCANSMADYLGYISVLGIWGNTDGPASIGIYKIVPNNMLSDKQNMPQS